MKPRIVEPVGPVSSLVFTLHGLCSGILHSRGRSAWRKQAAGLKVSRERGPLVNYGHLEGATRQAGLPIGGQIKLIPLRGKFPEYLDGFNLIYLVSSALPDHAEEIVAAARERGARLVWNQNGIAYPGCYGDRYAWLNIRMAALRGQADYIFNQSEFSRASAERYLGHSDAPSESCLNPVDTKMFSPVETPLEQAPWQILAAGTSHALYRTQSAADTLRCLLARGRAAHLTIAGEFRWKGAAAQVEKAMEGIREHVTFLPPFSQGEAPEIYRRAHVLLHTKFNDPCPTVPIEAMSCGVPVAATHSGGMPELVSDDSGILVPIEQSWTRDLAGDPELLADAVERIMEKHAAFSRAAREHAVCAFDLSRWLARHEAVFRELT
ncbi:MAG: glycosyltransferase family 4 protein [Verrucomicrobiota bacterium]